MKSILKDIYYGNDLPFERAHSRTKEYEEINQKIEYEKNILMKDMTDDEIKHFHLLEDLYTQANTFDESDKFIHGFRFAVLMLIESLVKSDI